MLSFDIAVQNLTYMGKVYATDHDASIEFRIDGDVVELDLRRSLRGRRGEHMMHVEQMITAVRRAACTRWRSWTRRTSRA